MSQSPKGILFSYAWETQEICPICPICPPIRSCGAGVAGSRPGIF